MYQKNFNPVLNHGFRNVLTLCLLFVFLASGCATSSRTGNSHNSESLDSQTLTKDQKSSKLVTEGFIQLASDNPSLAKMFFLRAVDQTPEYVQAYIGLGEVEYREGNYANAYINFAKASSIEPENIQAAIGKARAYRQQNKLNSAVQEVNAAIAINPNDIRVLTELAIIYDLMGKESLSAPIYQEILERAPDQAASSNNIGLNYIAQKKFDQAILAFERALSLDNENSRIRNNLGTAFVLYGNEQMAINIFKETVGEAGAYNNLGYLFMTQGRLNDAERALHKAMEMNPVYYEKAHENLERVQQLKRTQKNTGS